MIGSWFATDHDEPPHVIENLPIEVDSGRDPGLCIVDQVVRGAAIVGRVTGDHGAVGLKVRAPGIATRVSVVIHLDETAARWWSDRVRPPRFAPELPRLVLVRAQGELRGAALLARRQGLRRAAGAKVTVEFDLGAADLDGDGLLMIELAEPPRPEWVHDRIAARCALGLRIDQISVRPQPATTASPVPAGPTGCDLALLPAGGPERFRLETALVTPAPPLPRSPSTRLTRRKPARAALKLFRAARRAAIWFLALRPAALRAGPFRPAALRPRSLPSCLLPSRSDPSATHRQLPAALRAGPLASAAVVGVWAIDLLTGVPVELELEDRSAGALQLRRTGLSEGPVLIGLDPGGRDLSCRITVPDR
ncbi:hypothetical protein AB0M36_25700 [Actinoplanes sp. NPDC051346]|uniref:hypothetical protein n=1 Tax=Actinoplanes sp. NPDC051346 TaxID=3155048 RepID=UPI003412086A